MADQQAFYDFVRARQVRQVRRADRAASQSPGRRIYDSGVAQTLKGMGLAPQKDRGQPMFMRILNRGLSVPDRVADITVGLAKVMLGAPLGAPSAVRALRESFKLSGMKTSAQARAGRAKLGKSAAVKTMRAMRAPSAPVGGRARAGAAGKPGSDGFTKGYTRRSSTGRSVTVKGYSTPKR